MNRRAYARARGLVGAVLAQGIVAGQFRRLDAAEAALFHYLEAGAP